LGPPKSFTPAKYVLGIQRKKSFISKQVPCYSTIHSGKILAAMEDDNADPGADSDSEYRDEDGHERVGIVIHLTPEQVGQFVKAATGVGNLSILLRGQMNIRETLAREPELLQEDRISRSLMRGLLVIDALPKDGSYIGVVDLSKAAGMSASTAHRYLATLVIVGLVERDSSRRYRLAR
jgi:uncharacterized membrane protein